MAYDDAYQARQAASRGILGHGQATAPFYEGAGIAEDCAPIRSVTGSPVQRESHVVRALQAIEEQLQYLDKATAALEQRLEVLRRPVPEGVEAGRNETSSLPGSQFANGLVTVAHRLGVINARLHRLSGGLDL